MTTKVVEQARHNLSAPPHRACGLTQAEQQGQLSLQLKVPGRVNLLFGIRRHLARNCPILMMMLYRLSRAWYPATHQHKSYKH